MNDNNHITKEEFIIFQNDIMDQTDKEIFLEHICSCDFCAEQFATLMSEEIITAPRDLKANILKATKRPEIQLAIKVRETSKRMQLFIYSLKVGTATVCALLLLLFTMNFSNGNSFFNTPENASAEITTVDKSNISLTSKMWDKMDTISNSMLDFTNNILNGGN